MMKFSVAMKRFSLVGACLGMTFAATANVWADKADAAVAGAVEIGLLEAVFTGNIGLTIGLALVIVAIWRGFVKGDMAGAVVLAVIGVVITILPGVYGGLRNIACPIAEAFGGKCGGGAASAPAKES